MGSVSNRRGLVGIVVLGLMAALVTSAGAAPDGKSFRVVFESEAGSETISAGVSNSFDVTIINTSDSVPLGAAEVTYPPSIDGQTEFIVEGLSVDGDWLVTDMGDGFRVSANDSQSRLAPCGTMESCPSVTVSMELTVLQPLSDGTTHSFSAEARQANNFNGTLNDLNLDSDSSVLAVTVRGLGERCEANPCSVELPREVDTSLRLVASCGEEDCQGFVGADIDSSYCDGSCVGQGVFWNPPADAEGDVTVELVIDKHAYRGSPNALTFWIDKGSGPVVCDGSCSYEVGKIPGGHYLVTVTLPAEDPRGFVS